MCIDMINSDLLKYFNLQRQIFGVCPNSNILFRLSDCAIYIKEKRLEHDWLEKYDKQVEQIENAELKLEEKKEAILEAAREKGRAEANRIIRKVDKIFAPKKLNPDDSKVIFHPVDFVVFNGMKKKSMKEIVLLDSKRVGTDKKKIQQSIEKAIEKNKYEWLTLRVNERGKITQD